MQSETRVHVNATSSSVNATNATSSSSPVANNNNANNAASSSDDALNSGTNFNLLIFQFFSLSLSLDNIVTIANSSTSKSNLPVVVENSADAAGMLIVGVLFF